MGYIKTQILASKKLSINRSEYKFNLNENIDRLIQQIDGDPALLYLSIFAFIEGYFRDKDPSYDFDARNKDRNGKTWMLYSILSDQIFKITHIRPPGHRLAREVLLYGYMFDHISLCHTGPAWRKCSAAGGN